MQLMHRIVILYICGSDPILQNELLFSVTSVGVEWHWIAPLPLPPSCEPVTPGASFISIQWEQMGLNDVNTTSHTNVRLWNNRTREWVCLHTVSEQCFKDLDTVDRSLVLMSLSIWRQNFLLVSFWRFINQGIPEMMLCWCFDLLEINQWFYKWDPRP